MKKERIERVIGKLNEMGMGQLIVSDPDSLYYLLGHSYDPGERLLALYINDEGRAVLFHNHMFFFPEQEDLQIAYYDDIDDYMGLVAETVGPGTLGVDKFLRAKFLVPLMSRRPDIRVELGSGAVDWARKYKDEEERALMRAASLVNDYAVGQAISHVGEDLDEMEFGDIVCDAHMSRGADTRMEQLVCLGVNTAEPHHVIDRSRLTGPGPALFDIYAPVNHYHCDMTRTVFWKDVTPRQREVYELVREANAAGKAAVKPGVPLKDIDRAARSVIEEAGYGPYFTHRLGHGCGLALHEPPDVSSASEDIAEPGMCFSVEPGIYLPGEFGVRIEDLVIVTEDGVECLNHYPRDLQVVE